MFFGTERACLSRSNQHPFAVTVVFPLLNLRGEEESTCMLSPLKPSNMCSQRLRLTKTPCNRLLLKCLAHKVLLKRQWRLSQLRRNMGAGICSRYPMSLIYPLGFVVESCSTTEPIPYMRSDCRKVFRVGPVCSKGITKPLLQSVAGEAPHKKLSVALPFSHGPLGRSLGDASELVPWSLEDRMVAVCFLHTELWHVLTIPFPKQVIPMALRCSLPTQPPPCLPRSQPSLRCQHRFAAQTATQVGETTSVPFRFV